MQRTYGAPSLNGAYTAYQRTQDKERDLRQKPPAPRPKTMLMQKAMTVGYCYASIDAGIRSGQIVLFYKGGRPYLRFPGVMT